MQHRFIKQFYLLIAALIMVGCSTISVFNQKGYEQATSLKVDALALMDKAIDPYADHEKEIKILKTELDKAYEYAKGRPQNSETTDQWLIIKSPERNSLGGFMKKWKQEKALMAGIITEAKILVSDGFDTVIELESGKRKPNEGKN